MRQVQHSPEYDNCPVFRPFPSGVETEQLMGVPIRFDRTFHKSNFMNENMKKERTPYVLVVPRCSSSSTPAPILQAPNWMLSYTKHLRNVQKSFFSSSSESGYIAFTQ